MTTIYPQQQIVKFNLPLSNFSSCRSLFHLARTGKTHQNNSLFIWHHHRSIRCYLTTKN